MLNTNAESHRAAYTIFLLRTILFLNCFGSSFCPNFMVHLGGTSCQDISICEQVAINSWVPMSDPGEQLWRSSGGNDCKSGRERRCRHRDTSTCLGLFGGVKNLWDFPSQPEGLCFFHLFSYMEKVNPMMMYDKSMIMFIFPN